MIRPGIGAAVIALTIAWVAVPPEAAALPSPQPNIIVIVTDDQPKGTLDALPNTRSMIRDKGLSFTNGVIPTSWCCPSRSALLTGNLAHTTGVYTNAPLYGGWQTFHENGWENKNIAVALDDAGYRTGFFGKYLNAFETFRPADYVPPGWDVFRAILPQQTTGYQLYYDYQLTGLDTYYGSSPGDYSTDVIADMATQFIQDSQVPFFLYFAPFGPHAPYLPAPRDEGTWPLETLDGIPALNEKDVSDKPRWVRDRPLATRLEIRRDFTDQHETLMSVDDAVGRLLNTTDLSNTLVVYLSDNGYMLGSHRLLGKNVPYRMSTEVPMMVRWDGQVSPGMTNRVTPQIDLTALIRDAAGASLQMEGRNPLTADRGGVVLEQTRASGHPGYCGWRSTRYQYVRYDAKAAEEFYDYRLDPEELENAIGRRRYAGPIAVHRARALAQCSPKPPGFSWK